MVFSWKINCCSVEVLKLLDKIKKYKILQKEKKKAK